MVDFISHGRFSLDWRVEFGDKESDIVIFKLLKTKPGQTFPRPMLLDENYRQHGNIRIIRFIHNHPPKVVVDQDTRVFQSDEELQKDVNEAIKWWTTRFKDEKEDFFHLQYSVCCKSVDHSTGRVILRASKSFIPGSSGSPVIYMFNSNGVAVAEMIYQGGYPTFYYEAQSEHTCTDELKKYKDIDVDNKCFFERGTTMKRLAKLLEIYGKRNLKDHIFSQPICKSSFL